MKSKLIASLLLSSAVLFGNAAMASDELAGALIGAGAGAVIGNAIDSRDGAAVGGILGAMLGVAIADNDDHWSRARHHDYRPVYGPPAVYYGRPPLRPYPPFVRDGRYYPPGHYNQWHDRDNWRGDRWDRDNDRGGYRGDRDNDRGPGRDGHGRDDRGGYRGR